MKNGKVIIDSLKLVDINTLQPIRDGSGNIITKPNIISDPDYIAPYYDNSLCGEAPAPITTTNDPCFNIITGNTIDCTNPLTNVLRTGLSTLQSVLVDLVIKKNNIVVWTGQALSISGNAYFNVPKDINGEVILIFNVLGCEKQFLYTINCVAVTTTTPPPTTTLIPITTTSSQPTTTQAPPVTALFSVGDLICQGIVTTTQAPCTAQFTLSIGNLCDGGNYTVQAILNSGSAPGVEYGYSITNDANTVSNWIGINTISIPGDNVVRYVFARYGSCKVLLGGTAKLCAGTTTTTGSLPSCESLGKTGPNLISILSANSTVLQFNFYGIGQTSIKYRIKQVSSVVRTGTVDPTNDTPFINYASLPDGSYTLEIESNVCISSSVSSLGFTIGSPATTTLPCAGAVTTNSVYASDDTHIVINTTTALTSVYWKLYNSAGSTLLAAGVIAVTAGTNINTIITLTTVSLVAGTSYKLYVYGNNCPDGTANDFTYASTTPSCVSEDEWVVQGSAATSYASFAAAQSAACFTGTGCGGFLTGTPALGKRLFTNKTYGTSGCTSQSCATAPAGYYWMYKISDGDNVYVIGVSSTGIINQITNIDCGSI